MSWRDNWLMALPPAARVLPPLLLAMLGGLLLAWLKNYAPGGFLANLAPLVWCAVGAGLLVRPAQSTLISAAAFGMTGLAAYGVVGAVHMLNSPLGHPAAEVRTALWGVLTFLALPAAIWEAMGIHPTRARRFYFAAVALFFVEQGIKRAVDPAVSASEPMVFFMLALLAFFAVAVAERTVVISSTEESPSVETTEGDFLPTRRPVRYLDESPRT